MEEPEDLERVVLMSCGEQLMASSARVGQHPKGQRGHVHRAACGRHGEAPPSRLGHHEPADGLHALRLVLLDSSVDDPVLQGKPAH
eukprot:8959158-Heterocapsa_arctica.AAC.1